MSAFNRFIRVLSSSKKNTGEFKYRDRMQSVRRVQKNYSDTRMIIQSGERFESE